MKTGLLIIYYFVHTAAAIQLRGQGIRGKSDLLLRD